MRVRAIDGSGDWLFGKGRQNYRIENNAIAQCIKTRLLSFINDAFWDIDFGIDWRRLLGYRGNKEEIVYECKRIILGTTDVKKLVSFDITTSGRSATISFSVETIYSQTVTSTVEV
jgi:hypothetical protein